MIDEMEPYWLAESDQTSPYIGSKPCSLKNLRLATTSWPSGSGWESNPPNIVVRRFTGFEDRGGHQSRFRSLTFRAIAEFAITSSIRS